jgi:hypothetical protein
MFLRLIDCLFEEIEVFHTLGGVGEGHVQGSEDGTHTTSLTLFTYESENRRWGKRKSVCLQKSDTLDEPFFSFLVSLFIVEMSPYFSLMFNHLLNVTGKERE